MSAGLPAVLPNRGAVVDFMGGDDVESYSAGSPAELAQAAHRLMKRLETAEGRSLGRAEGRARDLSQHFQDLFSNYARISKGQ
jgi:hypothetical protein